MYDNFCPALPSHPCSSGGHNFLANRACDGIVDCNDGSDEEQATCDTVNNQYCSPTDIWISESGCLDYQAWNGLYVKSSQTLLNGNPRVLSLNTPGSSILSGEFYQMPES